MQLLKQGNHRFSSAGLEEGRILCILDGVCEAAQEEEGEDSPSKVVWFHESTALTRADVEALQETIHIAAPDRAGLERLVRYCARPPFVLNRIEWEDPGDSGGEGVVLYRLPRPTADGRTVIRLSPLELLDRLAALAAVLAFGAAALLYLVTEELLVKGLGVPETLRGRG